MKKIILFIFPIILVSACKKEAITEEVEQVEITKKNQIIINSDEFNIGRIDSPMLFYNQGSAKKLLFYDLGLNQILVTDTSGKILNAFGHTGSGPEEFRHITSYGIDADTVIVLDGSLDKIKKFTVDGKFQSMYDGVIEDGVWPRSNRIFEFEGQYFLGIQEAGKSSSNNHWESKTIAVYTRNGDIVELFGDFDENLIGSHQLYNYANISSSGERFIYTTHRTSPSIQKYDLKKRELVSRFGKLAGSFKTSEERPNVTDPREVKNKINVKYSFVGDSFVSDKYFAFYFFNFTEKYYQLRNPNDKEHFLHLYDIENDSLIGEIKLPFLPLGMDSESNLYLMEDDNPENFKLGVYEININ